MSGLWLEKKRVVSVGGSRQTKELLKIVSASIAARSPSASIPRRYEKKS
jgi:hypothetical protein